MKEVLTLVYQRMIADNGSGGLLNLLGESITPPVSTLRVQRADQVDTTPPSPGVLFGVYSTTPGQLSGDTRREWEVFIQFNIFAQNCDEIAFRLMRLFDGHNHNLSLISGGAVQVGGVTSVFDFEGPDGYDEALETQKKDMRFRFFTKIKAQSPI